MAYKNRILPTGGEQGPPGEAATVSVGTTTTGAPGTNANVTQGGTPQARVFNFTIPRGDTGATGAAGTAATVSVGTTTTGAPGTNASVTQGGTAQARTFSFTIPRGDTGATGAKGDTGATGPKGDKGDPGGVVDSGWVSLSLSTGWTGTARYRIIGGVVYLRGRVTRTSGSNTTILTLPASARPADSLNLLIRAGSAASSLLHAGISTNGAVLVPGSYSSGATVELESLPPFPLG